MQPSMLSGKKEKTPKRFLFFIFFSSFRAVIVGKEKKSLGKVIHIHRQPQDPALHGASRGRRLPSNIYQNVKQQRAARNVFFFSSLCFFRISLILNIRQIRAETSVSIPWAQKCFSDDCETPKFFCQVRSPEDRHLYRCLNETHYQNTVQQQQLHSSSSCPNPIDFLQFLSRHTSA